MLKNIAIHSTFNFISSTVRLVLLVRVNKHSSNLGFFLSMVKYSGKLWLLVRVAIVAKAMAIIDEFYSIPSSLFSPFGQRLLSAVVVVLLVVVVVVVGKLRV